MSDDVNNVSSTVRALSVEDYETNDENWDPKSVEQGSAHVVTEWKWLLEVDLGQSDSTAS